MRGKEFTTTDVKELKEYIDGGYNYEEIAELMGRTVASLRTYISRNGLARKRTKPKRAEEPVEKKVEYLSSPSPVKEKTLKDFSPREMIKYLYGLGYRIENNQLVCLVKQTVNVKDIING